MSYILDALRKSEQERQRGKVPDFTSPAETPTQQVHNKNIWPIVAMVAVVINLAAAAYFVLFNKPQIEQATQTVPNGVADQSAQPLTPIKQAPQVAQPVSKPVPSTQPVQPPAPVKTVAEPVAAVIETPAPEPQPTIIRPKSQRATQPVTAEPEPMPSVGYLPQLEELPSHQRQSIPDLTFSSHMYSSMPKYRSIIINGKRLKEGQFFNEDLQVREITESGVIMSQQGSLFEVDVLGRWAQ